MVYPSKSRWMTTQMLNSAIFYDKVEIKQVDDKLIILIQKSTFIMFKLYKNLFKSKPDFIYDLIEVNRGTDFYEVIFILNPGYYGYDEAKNKIIKYVSDIMNKEYPNINFMLDVKHKEYMGGANVKLRIDFNMLLNNEYIY